VDFNIRDQLLVRFSAFVRYWRKKYVYDSIRLFFSNYLSYLCVYVCIFVGI
jgi:hypothetical protein